MCLMKNSLKFPILTLFQNLVFQDHYHIILLSNHKQEFDTVTINPLLASPSPFRPTKFMKKLPKILFSIFLDIFNSSQILTNYFLIFQLSDLPMQESQSSQIHDEKSRMIKHFMGQVKAEDMLNIAFMKPIEVALRTNKNDKSVPSDSLPQGLMIAQKNSINDNKYSLKRFKPVEASHLEDLRANQMDNYISLLKKPQQKYDVDAQRMSRINMQKQTSANPDRNPEGQQSQAFVEPRHQGMQIGICVSMKNESKRALKSTMKGVANNIDEMIRSGVSPDDIFVVVMIDGVRSVDPSLYEYFEEFQRESQIFLEQDEDLTLRKKYQHQLYHNQIQTDEPLNYSKFLFKEQEFHERLDCKFSNIRKKYDQVLRIKKSIQNIKKENASDNQNLKMIVNRLADKQKTIMKKINKGAVAGKSVVISQDSIMKELASSQEQCNQYVNTRQDLAYVSVYRLPTASLSEDCKLKAQKLAEKQNGEMQEQLNSERLSEGENSQRRSLHQSLNQNGKISAKVLYANIFFCIKYKQAGKLNSHNWFINGFCQQLNPKYSFLIDVGVRPYPEALFKMYRHMKMHPKVGGVCGYLRLIQELVEDEQNVNDEDLDCLSSCLRSIFDIQRSQQIQTHYDHIMEKSFQGLFNFVHAVPGFFSGYNMSALRPPGKKDELLRQYFRSIDDKLANNKVVPSTFTAGSLIARVILPRTLWKKLYKIDPDSEQQLLANQNTYQAQNRILCLGIHKNNREITYMPNVYAQVEPIKRINDLMEHKKQEINGGVFSFQKVQKQFDSVIRKRDKFFVRFQLLYLSSMKFIMFFAPALLMFLLQFAAEIIQNQFLQYVFATESDQGLGNVIYRTFENILTFIFTMCLLSMLFFSLHLNYKDKRFTYYAHLTSTILGIFSFLMFIVFLVHIILNIVYANQSFFQLEYVYQLGTFMDADTAVQVADILVYLIYISFIFAFLPAILYAIVFAKFSILWEVLIGSLTYLFYIPTEYCILQMYARCKLDDVYQNGSTGARSQKLRDTWNIVKMVDVSKYLFWNVIVGVTLLLLQNILLVKFFLLLALLGSFVVLFLIKWIPGLIYLIRYRCRLRSQPYEPTQEQRERSVTEMKLRVFDIIKSFQEDFTYNIHQSFQEAAAIAQIKEMQKKQKLQAAQRKAQEQLKGPQPAPKKTFDRGGSIAFNTLIGARLTNKVVNQQGLTNKVQHIRESSAIRPSYYPFQEGIAKKAVPKPSNTANSANMPLQMILLKNQVTKEVANNADMKEGEEKLKKYQNFRNTIKPLGF